MRGCFVTGTDTGVGKTVVTAALVVALKQRNAAVGVMKPVETGCELSDGEADAVRLRSIADMIEPLELIAPYRFAAPLAPRAVAEAAERRIEACKIREAFEILAGRYPYVLVEGLGGVRVPIAEEYEVVDMMRQLALPAVVIGRAAIGGVNHALLTLEAVQRRGITVLALVLNDQNGSQNGSPHSGPQLTSTVQLLRQLAGVPVLGPLPYLSNMTANWRRHIGALADDPAIQRLADLIMTAPERPALPRRRPGHRGWPR